MAAPLLRSRRMLTIALLGASLLGPGLPAVLAPAPAVAQAWTPKKKKRPKPARGSKKPRPRPADEPPASDAPDGPVYRPTIIEEEPAADAPPAGSASKPAAGSASKPAAGSPAPAAPPDTGGETAGDTAGGSGDTAGAAAGGSGDTTDGDASSGPTTDDSAASSGGAVRIEDDLDDVGAKVDFSASDLATDSAAAPSSGSAADAAGVTRLETQAMAYGRLGIDMAHDPVPAIGPNLPAVGEDVFAFRLHGRAEGTSRFGERWKIKVAGRTDAELAFDADTNVSIERYQAEVWDTYADLYTRHLDLRFGKQLVSWGTADLLSPNDVVNPRDLRRGALDRPDELRLPVLALSAVAYDGPFALQGLWVPVAPTNRFELLEGDYALLGPNAPTAAERRVGALVSALASDPMLSLATRPILDIGNQPDNGLETGELGARASVTFTSFDLHLYGFWGHERNPRIRVDQELAGLLANTPPDMLTPQVIADAVAMISAAGRSPVVADYPRRVHGGAALAFRLEPFGIKVDAAYTPGANTILVPTPALTGGVVVGPLLGESRDLPQATGTLSLDYDRGTDLSIIVEASHLLFLDVPADRNVYQTPHDQLTIVATRAQWTPSSGPVTLSLLGFLDLQSPSYAIKPALRLSGHDNLSVELAAAIYGGPETTIGGIPDHNDEVILTVQYGI